MIVSIRCRKRLTTDYLSPDIWFTYNYRCLNCFSFFFYSILITSGSPKIGKGDGKTVSRFMSHQSRNYIPYATCDIHWSIYLTWYSCICFNREGFSSTFSLRFYLQPLEIRLWLFSNRNSVI